MTNPKSPDSFLKNFVTGEISSAIATLIHRPIFCMNRFKDLKSLRGIQYELLERSANKYVYLWNLIKEDGIFSLYHGSFSTIMGTFLVSGLNFAFFEFFKSKSPYDQEKDLGLWIVSNYLFGGLAGVLSLFPKYSFKASHPKSKLSYQEHLKESYRGFAVASLGIFIYRAFLFGTYEVSKSLFVKNDDNMKWLYYIFSAGISVLAGNIMSCPVDYIRRQHLVNFNSKRLGAWEIMKSIYKEKGVAPFVKFRFKDFFLIKSTLILLSYDTLKYVWNKEEIL